MYIYLLVSMTQIAKQIGAQSTDFLIVSKHIFLQGTVVNNAALRSIFLVKNLAALTLPRIFSVGHHRLLTQWTDLPKINWIYVVDLNRRSQDFLSAWYLARNRRNFFVLQKLAEVASSNFQGLFEKDTFKSPLSLKF